MRQQGQNLFHVACLKCQHKKILQVPWESFQLIKHICMFPPRKQLVPTPSSFPSLAQRHFNGADPYYNFFEQLHAYLILIFFDLTCISGKYHFGTLADGSMLGYSPCFSHRWTCSVSLQTYMWTKKIFWILASPQAKGSCVCERSCSPECYSLGSWTNPPISKCGSYENSLFSLCISLQQFLDFYRECML